MRLEPWLIRDADAGDPQGLSATQRRRLLEGIVAMHRAHGDSDLHHVDGLALFGHADAALQPDGVHPDAAGYRLIGERFHAAMLAPGRPLAAAVGCRH